MKKLFIYISLSILIVLLLLFLYSNYKINERPVDNQILVEIKKGYSTNRIIEELSNQGYLKPELLFKVYIRYLKYSNKKFLQAGHYKFKSQMSNSEIIESLFSGKNIYTIKVTFPEGISLLKYASILKEKLNLDSVKFLKLANDVDFLNKVGITSTNAEGYLFPETYQFLPDEKPENILRILIKTQLDKWTDEFRDKANNLGFSKHEILTLASIIEAETPIDGEKPKVSGLYHNRLKKGMLLQADPTVQYALGFKEKLLFSDLEINNRYNTYKFPGLPPGPINNPGIKSIIAALNPEEHDYYYMVAVGDGSGKHNFARTFDEHKVFVRQYRKLKN